MFGNMSDIIWFFVGILFGILISHRRKDNRPIVEVLTNQVEELEHQVEYYKDLCAWHVDEKEKLKRENYIK
jgi:hypothetical protein